VVSSLLVHTRKPEEPPPMAIRRELGAVSSFDLRHQRTLSIGSKRCGLRTCALPRRTIAVCGSNALTSLALAGTLSRPGATSLRLGYDVLNQRRHVCECRV
jgi:hypothetical protein